MECSESYLKQAPEIRAKATDVATPSIKEEFLKLAAE
jgi:hypothetical protein